MSIKTETLKHAIAEAGRFLKAAKLVEKTAEDKNSDWYYGSGKYCAAAKRASMDLSRALVAVRRGDRR